MQEVQIEIQFTQPSLGYARQYLGKGRGVIYRMPRDGAGRVMFLPSWWRDCFAFASKVLGRYHAESSQIVWSPGVTGKIDQWRRNLPKQRQNKRVRYALHEAFRPGTLVRISAVLPADLPISGFTELLRIVGEYKGISPFKNDQETYGTFTVSSVKTKNHENREDDD